MDARSSYKCFVLVWKEGRKLLLVLVPRKILRSKVLTYVASQLENSFSGPAYCIHICENLLPHIAKCRKYQSLSISPPPRVLEFCSSTAYLKGNWTIC